MKMIDIKGIRDKLNSAKENMSKKFNSGAFDPKKFDIKNFKFNKKVFLVIVAALIVITILVRTTMNIQKTLFKKKADIAAKSRPITFEEDAVAVKAYKVKRMDFKDTLPSMGNVKGFKEADLKFQVAGMIESFNFEEGEKIQEGDIIASLIQKDALLKLKYSEIELSKNKKLFEIGAISPLKMDQSKLEYESAKSDLDKTNIYAMSSGLMGPRIMDVGNYITPNEKAGIFVNIDKVFGEFNIIEKDIPKIALGQKVEVFADAYPGKSFTGSVDRISPVIEGRSRTQTIKVELDNKDSVLKPGMFVRALISTYEKKDALVVPSSSLKKKENEYLIYVIHKEEHRPPEENGADADKKKDKTKGLFGIFGVKPKDEPAPEMKAPKEKAAEHGTVEPRKLTLGYMSEDLVEVEKGIAEDELIIVEVQEEFKDKAKVEIAEVQEGII